MERVLPTRGLAGPLHRGAFGGRVDVARKGAPPVAEEATAAVGQPLALADRSAGREGLAATRTIDPYGGEGIEQRDTL